MVNRTTRRATASKRGAAAGKAAAKPERQMFNELPEGAQVLMSDAPKVYASGAQIVNLGNEFLISFNRHLLGRFVGMKDVPENAVAGQVVATAEISVSPMTLKDLSILVNKAVADWESEWGEIETPYSRMRASEK